MIHLIIPLLLLALDDPRPLSDVQRKQLAADVKAHQAAKKRVEKIEASIKRDWGRNSVAKQTGWGNKALTDARQKLAEAEAKLKKDWEAANR